MQEIAERREILTINEVAQHDECATRFARVLLDFVQGTAQQIEASVHVGDGIGQAHAPPSPAR